MRKLHNEERKHRGCDWCADSIAPEYSARTKTQRKCPYDECPYSEMDGFDKYKDYVLSIGSDNISTLMRELNLGTIDYRERAVKQSIENL